MTTATRASSSRFSPAHRDALLAILREHPRASRAEVAGLFRAATGRSATLRTIGEARRRAGLPTYVASGQLSPGERAAVADLVRRHPGASCRRLASLSAAAVGRPVSDVTIGDIARSLSPAPPPPSCFPALPRDQAAALAWIAAHRPDLTALECVALLAMEMDR